MRKIDLIFQIVKITGIRGKDTENPLKTRMIMARQMV